MLKVPIFKFNISTMDIEPPNVYQVLNDMQNKIAMLFQDLMTEKNIYKQSSENLNMKLKQLSADAEIIKKENEALKEIYDKIKSIIYAGARLFKNANFSNANLKKEHEIELENFRKIFLDTIGKLEKFESNHMLCKSEKENSSSQMERSPKASNKRFMMDEAEIQKEFESIKELKFSTQFFNADETEENIHERVSALNTKNSESFSRNLVENKPQSTNQVTNKSKIPVVVPESETFYLENDESTCKKVQSSFEESVRHNSPVFKDFGSCKEVGLLFKETHVTKTTSSPFELVNGKFIEKSKNLALSPWKKSSHVNENSPTRGFSTPKRAKRKLEIHSPRRSPKAQLKKSNTKEAEISVSGVRKLTQTLLNVECYRRKGIEEWKSCENRENKNITIDPEEDDFITESPKKTDQSPEEVKSKSRNENALRDVQLITPPETSEADLDETYISSSIVRKCKLTKKHFREETTNEQTPVKRMAREKSPEFDSVPFAYKRDPIRKKAERMKLPGHACLECNKYYENALGDIDTQNLKKILNKCSRHRDKYSPVHDETPPGYWKPYLTCSIMMSPKENRA